MNLITIAEHTVDLFLINHSSKVLDLGCRNFTWSKAMLEYVDEVYCVDADPGVKRPYDTKYRFINAAISTKHFENLLLRRYGNGTGNFIADHRPNEPDSGNGIYVTSTNLDILSNYSFKVPFWDVIKFDIEGSEIPVLLDLKKPPAKQLSIEFHVHTGSTKEQVQKVVTHLEELGYECVQHEFTSQHGAGFNYWDSLFIMRK